MDCVRAEAQREQVGTTSQKAEVGEPEPSPFIGRFCENQPRKATTVAQAVFGSEAVVTDTWDTRPSLSLGL